MKSLILLSLVAVAFSFPQVPVGMQGMQLAAVQGAVPAPSPVPTYTYVPSAQYHSQNEVGGYNYGYVSADGQGKNEIRGADGSVAGTYTYLDPTGLPVQVSYSAGPQGFQASGLHLPKPVPLPEANVRATQAHMAAKAAAAAAAARAAATAPQPTVGVAPTFAILG